MYYPYISPEWKNMSLDLKDWGTFPQIGKGYGFTSEGRFYSLLETKAGSYRGNHTHPYDQYSVLVAGSAKYVWKEGGKTHEKPLEKGKVFPMKAGVPHVMVPETDIVTFEWWDGPFVAENLKSVFDAYTDGKQGPDKIRAKGD